MDIKSEIKDYIETKEQFGALLLTGNWGCGKTYAIHRIAEELNKGNDFIIVTISLFGLTTVNDLDRKVKESIFYRITANNHAESTKSIVTSIKKFISPITSALSEYSKVAKGLNTALSISLYDFISPEPQIKCPQNGGVITKNWF